MREGALSAVLSVDVFSSAAGAEAIGTVAIGAEALGTMAETEEDGVGGVSVRDGENAGDDVRNRVGKGAGEGDGEFVGGGDGEAAGDGVSEMVGDGAAGLSVCDGLCGVSVGRSEGAADNTGASGEGEGVTVSGRASKE